MNRRVTIKKRKLKILLAPKWSCCREGYDGRGEQPTRFCQNEPNFCDARQSLWRSPATCPSPRHRTVKTSRGYKWRWVLARCGHRAFNAGVRTPRVHPQVSMGGKPKRRDPNSGKCLRDQNLLLFDVSQRGSFFCLEPAEANICSPVVGPPGPWSVHEDNDAVHDIMASGL